MIIKAQNIPDEILLEFMTNNERKDYHNARPPYRSLGQIRWRFFRNYEKKRIVKRIERDPAQCGKLLAKWAAWLVFDRL